MTGLLAATTAIQILDFAGRAAIALGPGALDGSSGSSGGRWPGRHDGRVFLP